uniref:Reverse transcriptase zinc-binding domain-containing protein n=1 Tax=Xenopus tropicalis TaxID=8364 RepID=A0A803KGD6_XENTR
MFLFPKLLYPMQMLPYHMKTTDLKRLNNIFRTFIWNKNRPKISLAKLEQPKHLGGLNLPNVKEYNEATLLRYVGDWLLNRDLYTTTALDQHLTGDHSINYLLHTPLIQLSHTARNNPLFIDTHKAWHSVKRRHGMSPNISPYLSWIGNKNFPIGIHNTTLLQWSRNGLHNIHDLQGKDLRIISQTKMTKRYPFTTPHIYLRMQIVHYSTHITKQLTDRDKKNPINQIWKDRKTIQNTSTIYKTIRTLINPDDEKRHTFKWTNDIPNTNTSDILKLHVEAMKLIPVSKYQDMSIQILHNSYLTPERRHKIGNLPSDKCLRCRSPKANLIHNLWSCPKTQIFWNDIASHWTQMTGKSFQIKLEWALFSTTKSYTNLTTSEKQLAGRLSAAARKTILHQWLTTDIPSKTLAKQKLHQIFYMDWLEATTRKEQNAAKFFNTWLIYISSLPQTIRHLIVNTFRQTAWYDMETLREHPLVVEASQYFQSIQNQEPDQQNYGSPRSQQINRMLATHHQSEPTPTRPGKNKV